MTSRSFSIWVDKAFWYLLCGAAAYCASKMNGLIDSVSELKTQVAIVGEKIAAVGKEASEGMAHNKTQDQWIFDIDKRLTASLEKQRQGGR